MRNFASYRVTAHVCLYLALIQLTTLFESAPLPVFLMCGLIFAASFIAVRFEQAWIRALISLVPAAALLFTGNAMQLAVLALPVGYLVLMMTLGRMDAEHWQFKKEFTLMCFIGFIVLLASLLLGYTSIAEMTYPIEPVYYCWALLTGMLLFGFLAIRSMRTGEVRSFKWQAGNTGFFLGAIALGAAVGFFIYFGLLPVLKVISLIIVAPLVLLMYGAMYVGQWFMKNVTDFESENVSTMPPSIDIEQEPVAEFTHVPRDPYIFHRLDLNIRINWAAVGIGLIMLLAAALMIAAIVISRRRRMLVADPNASGHVADANEEKRGVRRRKAKKKNNAESIRFIYRQYLSFLHLHGIIPERSRTTGEISERAKEILLESDEVFRALYRKARYGSGDDVTDEDVRLAEETYERIVNDENLKPKEERNE